MDSDELAAELRAEKTSTIVFWVGNPTALLDVLLSGYFDSVKPSEAEDNVISVEYAARAELDRRIPVPMEAW